MKKWSKPIREKFFSVPESTSLPAPFPELPTYLLILSMENFQTELQVYLDTNTKHFAQPHRLCRLLYIQVSLRTPDHALLPALKDQASHCCARIGFEKNLETFVML